MFEPTHLTNHQPKKSYKWLGGVLVRLMGRMGLVFKNLSRRVGGNSLNTLDLGWGMVLRLDFGMMCSAESKPLR